MNDQLLTIKLFAPPLRTGLVSRPRLIQKLNQSLQQGSRLTLFSAPAGYGKTTLALEWLSNLNRPFVWFSLDRTDNHPIQFFNYLTAALKQLAEKDQDLFPLSFEHLQAKKTEEVLQILTDIVNQIAQLPAPFVFVLDDYHTITDLVVHQMVEFIIEHQPPQMHLVITTRQDPLLPLSKLRSRGQITEVRLGDLRFTAEESACFLNDTMGLGLLDEQISSLASRTEGWIAGLQLAALSLSDESFYEHASSRQEVGEFIRNFAGDDRHIMDYLLDEVLSRQPDEVQQFLLRTSILKRLCSPLCDEVLSTSDDILPSKAPASSRTILEYLERTNLFVIPLDNRRQWYRYHHLFADLLASRLQSSDPDLVPRLHHQASQWCEQEGLIADAVDHALLAEDFDRALGLIEHAARTSIWVSGDLPALLNWAKRLPEDVLITRPRLCIYNARALFFIGQIDAAENYLFNAETILKARGKSNNYKDELWGLYCTNRATFTAMKGELTVALEMANQARELIPTTDLSSHARIAHAVGVAEYYQGSVQNARQAFAQAVRLCQQANNRNLGLDVISCLAMTEILAGRLKEARRVCDAAFEGDPSVSQAPPASAIHLALAEILYEQNYLEGASEAVGTCIQLGEISSWMHVLWQAYALKSRICLAQQQHMAAIDAICQAEQIASRYRNPYLDQKLKAYRARIELNLGNRDAGEQWAEIYQRQTACEGLCDFEEVTLAAVRLANHRNQEASDILDRLIDLAHKAGREQTVLYASAIKSQIPGQDFGSGAIQDALCHAEQEGFNRIFLEFSRLAQSSLRSSSPTSTIQRAGSQTKPSPLIEPLSDRELEVLHFISEGLTNPEIAARLYLSVNTLRAHAANIYQKLNVHNRTEAVRRARQLGIIKDL